MNVILLVQDSQCEMSKGNMGIFVNLVSFLDLCVAIEIFFYIQYLQTVTVTWVYHVAELWPNLWVSRSATKDAMHAFQLAHSVVMMSLSTMSQRKVPELPQQLRGKVK